MVIIGEKNIKELIGKVVSTKMQNSIVVEVERVNVHPIYKKRYTVKKKFYAHDAEGIAEEGQTVKIQETRPISKLKRWKLIEIMA